MNVMPTETNVVVVEDDPASADVLQRRLQANGMSVSVGRTGGDGLALIRELHPDLVLLDVGLPDTDGYDVCLQVKSDSATADIPVIIATSQVLDRAEEERISNHAVAILSKARIGDERGADEIRRVVLAAGVPLPL